MSLSASVWPPCPEAGPALRLQQAALEATPGQRGTLRPVAALNGWWRDDKYPQGCGSQSSVPEEAQVSWTHFWMNHDQTLRVPIIFLHAALLLYFSAKP